ncbi:transcription antiterminator LacT [Streptococcus pneumoniae]|nr:transcription antiterminator LacT [Streptococcus pneumoniae]
MVSGSVFADSALTTVDKANDIVLNVDGNKFYNVSVSEDIVNAGQILEDHIKQSYPKAFEIGSKIYDVITQHTGLDLYKSERVYLVLHIQRLLS